MHTTKMQCASKCLVGCDYRCFPWEFSQVFEQEQGLLIGTPLERLSLIYKFMLSVSRSVKDVGGTYEFAHHLQKSSCVYGFIRQVDLSASSSLHKGTL